jgi:hypothetical protein
MYAQLWYVTAGGICSDHWTLGLAEAPTVVERTCVVFLLEMTTRVRNGSFTDQTDRLTVWRHFHPFILWQLPAKGWVIIHYSVIGFMH